MLSLLLADTAIIAEASLNFLLKELNKTILKWYADKATWKSISEELHQSVAQYLSILVEANYSFDESVESFMVDWTLFLCVTGMGSLPLSVSISTLITRLIEARQTHPDRFLALKSEMDEMFHQGLGLFLSHSDPEKKSNSIIRVLQDVLSTWMESLPEKVLLSRRDSFDSLSEALYSDTISVQSTAFHLLKRLIAVNIQTLSLQIEMNKIEADGQTLPIGLVSNASVFVPEVDADSAHLAVGFLFTWMLLLDCLEDAVTFFKTCVYADHV